MTTFFLMVLGALIVMMVLVLIRDLWVYDPAKGLPVIKIGVMLGYVLVLIAASVAIMKFVQ